MSLPPARASVGLAAVVVGALLGAACSGDDERTPAATPTTLPADAATSVGGEATGGDRLLSSCGAVGEAVEGHLGEDVVDVSRGSGGGLGYGNISYSTARCTAETDGASYEFAELLEVEVAGGPATRPLAVWEQMEAMGAASAEASDRSEQLMSRMEAAGTSVDGVLDEGDDILVLVGDTTYGVSFSGVGVTATPAELEGLAEVAVAVAQAAPDDVDVLCDVVVSSVGGAFGGHEGDPRIGGGGGSANDIRYETESCTFELRGSELRLQASISDEQHWEAASARVEGPGAEVRAQPTDGVGDGAFISGDELLVRIDDHVIIVTGRLDGEGRVSIPPGDLVDLAAAVLEG